MLLALPVMQVLESYALRSVRNEIASIEDSVGLGVSYITDGHDIFRQLTFQELHVSNHSILPEEIVGADYVKFSYNLPAMLLHSRESHLIQIESSGLRGIVSIEQINSIRSNLSLSRSAHNSEKEKKSWIQRKIAQISENLIIEISVSGANVKISLDDAELDIVESNAKAVIQNGRIINGSFESKMFEAYFSGSDFQAAETFTIKAVKPFITANLNDNGIETGFSLDSLEVLLPSFQKSSIKGTASFLNGNMILQTETLLPKTVSAEIDSVTASLLIQQDITLELTNEGSFLSLEQIEDSSNYSIAINSSTFRTTVSGSGKDISVFSEIRKPEVRFQGNFSSLTNFSSFSWVSGPVMADIPVNLVLKGDTYDKNDTLHILLPETSAEIFRNPTKKTLNYLGRSSSFSASIDSVFSDAPEGVLNLSFPTVLVETKNEELVDISFQSNTADFSIDIEDWKLDAAAANPQLFILQAEDGLSARLSAAVQASVFSGEVDKASFSVPLAVSVNFAPESGNITSQISFSDFLLEDILPALSGIISLETTVNSPHAAVSIKLEELSADLQYNSLEKTFSSILVLDNFLPVHYGSYMNLFIAQNLIEYIEPLAVSGSVELNGSISDKLTNAFYAGEFTVNNAVLAETLILDSFDIDFSGNSEKLAIHAFNTEMEGYDLSASGTLQLQSLIPEIQALITIPPRAAMEEKKYLSVQLTGSELLSGAAKVKYSDFPDLDLSFDYAVNSDFTTADFNGIVVFRDNPYIFNLSSNIPEKSAEARIGPPDSGSYSLSATLGTKEDQPAISGKFAIDNGFLPDYLTASPVLQSIKITAGGAFRLNNLEDWLVNFDNVELKGIEIKNKAVELSFSDAAISPQTINAGTVRFQDDYRGLSGKAQAGFITDDSGRPEFSSSIELRNDIEEYAITFSVNDGEYSIFTELWSADLRHLPFDLGTGYADGFLRFQGNAERYELRADLGIRNGSISRTAYSGKTRIEATEKELKIVDFAGKYGKNTVDNFSLIFEFATGSITSSSSQKFQTQNGLVSFDLDLVTKVQPVATFANLSINAFTSQNLLINAQVRNIQSNGISLLADFPAKIQLSNGALFISGGESESIIIEISRQGNIYASLGQDAESSLPLSLSLNGSYKDGFIDITSNDLEFDLTTLNSLLKFSEYLYFEEGKVYGTLSIAGALSDPDFYGEVFSDYVEITSGILRNKVTVENVSATISEKTLFFVPFYAQIDSSFVNVDITIDLEYIVPYYYDVTFNISEDNQVAMQKTIESIGLDFDGMISGTVNLNGAGPEMLISGNAVLDDTVISMAPEGKVLPDEKQMVSAELELLTRNNVSAVFPNRDFPIINATVSENQKLIVSYNASNQNYSVQGNLQILGGEIFYFQRSFFITSGRLRFNEDHLSQFDPLISLEAKLRDFDRSGEKVDIQLELQNDSYMNLSPILSSRPQKSLGEIAEILGQNILPAAYVGDTNISSALALATLAGDVIQQLGIIELDPISDFENIIRNNLQLDVFSIRTQVFQNIILETLSPSQFQVISINPIARYLDNTSIFLGKYMNNDLFLQAMFHISVNDRYGSGFFMTDDLKLDVELSMEWENPLYYLRISTQPEGLQPYQLLDALTLGISWNISL
ncbi:MAG: translocation/assembly module TamB [Spirochaetia bacterium]|nr:translocation/assembly module TamB [Spirochaetia bacterium]